MHPISTKHPDLPLMRQAARKAAAREGYDQVIIQAHDGSLSVSRAYPGCCPAWYGEIIEKFKITYTLGGAIIQRHIVNMPSRLAKMRIHKERSHT